MDPKIYLAPMSGVTDLAFRLVSRKAGAKHCFFEMLDSMAILHDRPRNRSILKTLKSDVPISAQLLGSDPYVMLDAAQKLISLVNICSLDINSACPAKKVVKKGAGAMLLKDAPALGRIIDKLASNIKVPVTVKLRTGLYERNVVDCVRAARICQENGASCVFIHGRTLSQGYYGGVDYGSIKAVKEALKIPVFGSGNIFNPSMAKKMLDETGCDGILVARGAMGNPWIFRDIENYLKGNEIHKEPDLGAKKKALKEHLVYVEKYKDISRGGKMGFMGKVTMWYLKGAPNAARIRRSIHRAKTYKELTDMIDAV